VFSGGIFGNYCTEDNVNHDYHVPHALRTIVYTTLSPSCIVKLADRS